MMKIFKKGISFLITFALLAGMIPSTVFAAVDSTGKPTDLKNSIVLSIYTPEGQFPGEPAVHSTSNYKSFKSDFTLVTSSWSSSVFKDSAESELEPSILNNLVEGTPSGSTTVWGAYDAKGMKKYFLEDASIIKRENEMKMIRAIKNISESDAEKYEIIWYVIKLQHSSGWFGRTEWHIDGVIKEKSKISINYYGNGNTSGEAPLGETNHTAGEKYTVLGQNTMEKKINGVEVGFLGWSAKADGTGEEAGFYQPGDVINPTESISLYAMWDTTTQYTATVYTYLDGVLTNDTDIHGEDWELYLSTDEIHYYPLNKVSTGVYNTKITGNGKFHLYNKEADGTYTQVGNNQLTIYNQDGSMEVYHYSVSYDPNGGAFATAQQPHNYGYGKTVTAITDIPTKDGYRFLGWDNGNGNIIQPGATVTEAITAKTVLKAVWEKNVSVIINVTINHDGGGGHDQMATKDEVTVALAKRADSSSPYLETGHILNLTNTNYTGFTYTPAYGIDKSEAEIKTTKYTSNGATYTNMPGGDAEYTVVTSKSGYDTAITHTKDVNGNWTIDVVMTYNPTNFDLDFSVTVDETVPTQYIPTAAIVKVLFWSTDRNQWEVITQQEGGEPGVRVDINPATLSGSGSYPVWRYESASSTPYGYRAMVSSFVYPDGTIVPASESVIAVSWTDSAYVAKMDDVVGGQKYGELDGAYFGVDSNEQQGKLNLNITIDLHDVTFDATGGTVNGYDKQLVEDQSKIPAFSGYVPTRDGGYIFDGWYTDANYTSPAVEGADLTNSITLYAKWIEPLTITGTVSVSGTYQQDGKIVYVHDVDRATEAVVVLQEIRDGKVYEVDSKTITFGSYSETGSADYAFTGIKNEGKAYQIHILLLNYITTYDNESDKGTSYSNTEYTAVFDNDNIADVDAHLGFEAPAYNQILNVDATAIGEDFRPSNVLSEVMYRDTGDNKPYNCISQHTVEPYGIEIDLIDGIGRNTQSVWQWHTNGTLYDYQMNVTAVDGTQYNSDTAPFYIVYDAPAYWNAEKNAPSGELKATLKPNQYTITFNLNAGDDAVTGMDSYLDDETGNYQTIHTWSFDTAINAKPVRVGYTFLGWETDVADTYDGNKIDADTHQDVVLTAKWEKKTYTVTTVSDPAEGGVTSGDGEYALGANVTVIASPSENYQLEGWYQNGEKVSENAEYTFVVTDDHTLTAKFTQKALKSYKITATANPEDGGTVSGGGTYTEGTKIVLSTQVNEGYTFVGWFAENGELITTDNEFTHIVKESKLFKARYNKISNYKNGYAYIYGYSNTEMGAEGPLLRSEVTAMVHRLVKQNNERGDFAYDPANPSFTDIAGEWFQCGIEFIHYKGGISAAEGTSVNPYAQITRGEVFKIVALGLGFTDDKTLTYDGYGEILAGYGYIIGSGGSGNLDSGSYMTRAEFCTMYNRIIGRTNALLVDANGNQITAETYGFTDLDPNAWYYEDMLRATSGYDENGFVDISKRAERNVVDDYS